MSENTEAEYWIYFDGSSEVLSASLAEISAFDADRYEKMRMMHLLSRDNWKSPAEFGIPHPNAEIRSSANCRKEIAPVSTDSKIAPRDFEVLTVTGDQGSQFGELNLVQLAAAIIELNRAMVQTIDATRVAARRSIQEAAKLGNVLLAAKAQIPHGCWAQWLEEQVKEISQDQAIRYMKLARQIPHMRNLDETKSLRQAYLAAGVIKNTARPGAEIKVYEENVREKKGFAYLFKQLRSLRVLFEKYSQTSSETEPLELEEISEEILKIALLFDKLKSRLDNGDSVASPKRSLRKKVTSSPPASSARKPASKPPATSLKVPAR